MQSTVDNSMSYQTDHRREGHLDNLDGASHAPCKRTRTQALHRRAGASSGAPLSAPLRSQFEASLGSDLSAVRVHTGAESATATASTMFKDAGIGTVPTRWLWVKGSIDAMDNPAAPDSKVQWSEVAATVGQ